MIVNALPKKMILSHLKKNLLYVNDEISHDSIRSGPYEVYFQNVAQDMLDMLFNIWKIKNSPGIYSGQKLHFRKFCAFLSQTITRIGLKPLNSPINHYIQPKRT